MEEKTSVPSVALIENLPSTSVTVPLEVPFTRTDTPGTGDPASSLTIPLTTFDCAKRSVGPVKSIITVRNVMLASLLMCNNLIIGSIVVGLLVRHCSVRNRLLVGSGFGVLLYYLA